MEERQTWKNIEKTRWWTSSTSLPPLPSVALLSPYSSQGLTSVCLFQLSRCDCGFPQSLLLQYEVKKSFSFVCQINYHLQISSQIQSAALHLAAMWSDITVRMLRVIMAFIGVGKTVTVHTHTEATLPSGGWYVSHMQANAPMMWPSLSENRLWQSHLLSSSSLWPNISEPQPDVLMTARHGHTQSYQSLITDTKIWIDLSVLIAIEYITTISMMISVLMMSVSIPAYHVGGYPSMHLGNKWHVDPEANPGIEPFS